ncbi:hypothetical protein [Paenibacillus odorifer]|uniref:Uncharacterized protein n=1 Tax=Paenibacillus odorifer TaxID=189426 RepID=A0A1R0WSB2_9BACL|nr:hypothetical protein [Paenibacillus odorifer]OMD20358.1 hypothetical protein BJP51_09755 [Paenibacillus odorifer]OMD58165.1 hypothetical protein BSK48_30675 [Paenibacillus odorifer]
MISLDKIDIINVFSLASESMHKEDLNDSQLETLNKFYRHCEKALREELLDLFPEVVHMLS